MNSVKLETSFNIEVEFAIAGFARRFTALTLDIIICWIYVALASAISGAWSFFIWTNVWELSGLIIALPVLFYHFLFEWLNEGRSPGKMLMKIQVFTLDGGRPAISQYLLRWLFRLLDFAFWIPIAVVENVLPWWTLPLTLSGLLCVVFTERSQRIGDLIAGTILIDNSRKHLWQDTIFEEVEEDYQPSFPQIMQLTDSDINSLKQIIETIRKTGDRTLADRIASRIQERLLIQPEPDSYQFLVILLKDYNYYTSANR